MVGAVTVACIIAGHRTGLYQAMSGRGPLSADDVAASAGTNPRLTREWLDQQASAGLAIYESSSDTYRLPEAVAAALADPASPFWMAGGLVGTQALYLDLDQAIEAIRGDGAVGWGEHHHYFFEGTEELFRPAYDHLLIQEWMPALSCGTDRLKAGIMVADIGCGNGASTVRMARAFPESTFTGFDFHAPSVEAARATASGLGLDNVSFEVASADGYSGPFDLIDRRRLPRLRPQRGRWQGPDVVVGSPSTSRRARSTAASLRHRRHAAHRPRGPPVARRLTFRGSVDDVQRVAQRLVEPRPCELIEMADGLVVKRVDRHGDDVVAADDTRFGKPMLGAQLDL